MGNSFEQMHGDQNPEEKWEEVKEAYKQAPGEYKEWAMSALNNAVARLEKEYPELKNTKHYIKDQWVKRLVWVLVSEAPVPGEKLSEERLGEMKEMGEKCIEELIKKYFTGERKLDEMLWEQQMEDTNINGE